MGGFRPLSGTYISQYLHKSVEFSGIVFPSPLGDLYISIDDKKSEISDYNLGFRPLSGTYISQLPEKSFKKIEKRSFRPLSGTYISQ